MNSRFSVEVVSRSFARYKIGLLFDTGARRGTSGGHDTKLEAP